MRLSSAIVLMFVFNLSITAAILAYDLGYMAQILLNVFSVRSNLKVDLKIATAAVRKSLPIAVYYLQNMIEASLVWIVVAITGNTVTVSYFESAFVLANVITWSQATQTGLIKKLSETKDPKVLETSLRLFSIASGLFLILIFAEGKDVLFKLRPDYVNSVFALYVIAFSNLLRGVYSIFYQSILMKDETLAYGSEGELKGKVAKLTRYNLFLSFIGVVISVFLMEVTKNDPPYIVAIAMSVGLLVNSLSMLFTSYSSSRSLYNFKLSLDMLIPIVISFVGIPLSFFMFTKSYVDMFLYAIVVIAIFTALNMANPYFRLLLRNARGFIRSLK